MIIDALKKILQGGDIKSDVAENVMAEIISGHVAPEQLGAFLTALHLRPLTSQMLAGFVRSFQKVAIPVQLPTLLRDQVIDVCGTGGDGLSSFNISTVVAFVAAAGGQPVAKHGNRAVSSRCGSFDVLEALGVPFADTPEKAQRALATFKLAFMFAPAFHPAFRSLASIRRNLGIRTVFNVLGPLLNPAGVRRQLIGVYSDELVIPMAEALGELGAVEAMVVAAADGSDEISVCSATRLAHLRNGRVMVYRVEPETFGFERAYVSALAGGDAGKNAEILKEVLAGKQGPQRDVVILNAAAAFVVGGQAEGLREGIALAQSAIDSQAAHHLLMTMSEPEGQRQAL